MVSKEDRKKCCRHCGHLLSAHCDAQGRERGCMVLILAEEQEPFPCNCAELCHFGVEVASGDRRSPRKWDGGERRLYSAQWLELDEH